MLISQYKLNIRVIVMNNKALGMITQFQHLYFNDRMAGTTSDNGYCVPNIETISKAYGIPYINISKENMKREFLINSKTTSFVIFNYQIEGLTTVCPKLAYNNPIESPMPLLEDEEFNDIMNV